MTCEMQSLPVSSLAALAQAAGDLNSTLEVDTVVATIARLAASVTRGEIGCVHALDRGRQKIVVLAVTGDRKDTLLNREFDFKTGIPGLVVETEGPVLITDLSLCPAFNRELDDLGSMGTQSIIATPMIQGGELIGVIEVVNRRDGYPFSETDLRVLQVFAGMAGGVFANARHHDKLKQQLAALRESVARQGTMIGRAPGWLRAVNLCERVARSPATVLILGETGTGKEMAARYIHNASRRHGESFVAINCAAMPETLLETELFGHEKGAFTGAHARRKGWFEVAQGGTLFLDEVGEISRPMQAKLLRALQEKTITPVGGTKAVQCDVRIIAATNRNLKNMMIDGLFREDLYYRLSVFPIQLPPLRERREDIPLFIEHFVDKSRRQCGIPNLTVASETTRILCACEWRGNVRELQNVVERSVLMSDGEILEPEHLPADLLDDISTDSQVPPEHTLHGQERVLILKALEETDWNQSRAARALGITRYHMRHRIRKYGLVKPDSADPSDDARPRAIA